MMTYEVRIVHCMNIRTYTIIMHEYMYTGRHILIHTPFQCYNVFNTEFSAVTNDIQLLIQECVQWMYFKWKAGQENLYVSAAGVVQKRCYCLLFWDCKAIVYITLATHKIYTYIQHYLPHLTKALPQKLQCIDKESSYMKGMQTRM